MVARGRIVGFLAFAVALGAARTSRAQLEEPAEPVSPPSPAILVSGIVLAAGGGAIQYFSAKHFADNAAAGAGWLVLGSVGGLTSEVGGALAAYWGWRLGENAFAVDTSTGAPIKERRSLALAAIAVGALGVAVNYAAQIYVFAKTFSCASDNVTGSAT